MADMFCPRCGNRISGKFCTRCGTPMNTQQGGAGNGTAPGYGTAPARGMASGNNKGLRMITGVFMLLDILAVIAAALFLIFLKENGNVSDIIKSLQGSAEDAGLKVDVVTRYYLFVFGYIFVHLLIAVYGFVFSFGKGGAIHQLLANILIAALFISCFAFCFIMILKHYDMGGFVINYYDAETSANDMIILLGAMSYIASAAVGSLFWLAGMITSAFAMLKERSAA